MGPTDWVAIYGAVVASILAALQFLDWRASRTFLSHSLMQVIDDDREYVVLTIRNRGNKPTTIEMIGAGKFAHSVLLPRKRTPLCIISMRAAEDNFGNGIGEPLEEFILQPGHQVYAAITKKEFDAGIVTDWQPKHTRVKNGIIIEHSQSDRLIHEEFAWYE